VSAFAAIRATIKRVKAREQQLVAWRAMLGERVVTRTRIALVVTDVLRIAAYLMVVMETVRAERPMPIAVAIMALGWFALSGLHLAFRDAILVRAFATMNPSTSRTRRRRRSRRASLLSRPVHKRRFVAHKRRANRRFARSRRSSSPTETPSTSKTP
jgi:hypothetical protein